MINGDIITVIWKGCGTKQPWYISWISFVLYLHPPPHFFLSFILFPQFSHTHLLSLTFVQHTIFPLPFLHPSSLCKYHSKYSVTGQKHWKYQPYCVLHYFSVSSKAHILCKYKQKYTYIFLLPFVIIEVKLCTCVIGWCIKAIWQLMPFCQTLFGVQVSKRHNCLLYIIKRSNVLHSEGWFPAERSKQHKDMLVYACIHTSNLLTLFLTTPLWLRVKMRCTLYVLVNMEPNAREKPAERRYTLAWYIKSKSCNKNHQEGWCSGNTLVLYSGGTQFELQPGYQLFWLKF
jgi:hypothetical protein